MLIEFSVSNFRSIREKQTLSMVAASRLRKKRNKFSVDVAGEKLPDLLKVAAIYGPNASGKSNLVLALSRLSIIIGLKPSARSQPLPVSPFRFDPNLSDAPSIFEIHFVTAGQRYEYELAATSERITRERLVAYPNGKEALLYERNHEEGTDRYTFGPTLEGGENIHDTWQRLTGPTVSFLSQAVANSSEDLKQLRVPYRWLSDGMLVVGKNMGGWAESSQELANKVPDYAKEISSFLQSIDVPVKNIRFDPIYDSIEIDTLLQGTSRDTKDSRPSEENKEETEKKRRTTLVHQTALGDADFDFSEESDGTKNLIGFWLPWSILGDSYLGVRQTLIVDELDSSLHPLIVAHLIEQHLNNKRPSQLIFTTHDTHLMDTKLLRRDQLWLTERDMNGATKLRSIHDFQGRESEDIEKRYYEGRYRSLPFVRKV